MGYKYDWISIHAPARGATDHRLLLQKACHISIHAPARGATSAGCSGSTPEKDFNPRAREGRDSRLAESWSCP